MTGLQREIITHQVQTEWDQLLTMHRATASLCRMEATLEYAETHFAQLLRHVVQGEEVLLREGAKPVARIVPFSTAKKAVRPQVGEITSKPVRWTEDSFTALDEAGMMSLGFL